MTFRQWLRNKQQKFKKRPFVSHVRFGSLRQLEPISPVFGLDRGLPIDRYYIEAFLANNRKDIYGRVLEIGNSTYTLRFGGSLVTQADVLHARPGNPRATLVGDLETGEGIPQNSFDCMILTQTLHCIYDVHTAVSNAFNALRPGGVLLATVPGISQISRYDMDRWGDYWRFTTGSAQRLFAEIFQTDRVTVVAYGNVLASIAFLHGLAVEDLKQKELTLHDPDYELLITIRAKKAEKVS